MDIEEDKLRKKKYKRKRKGQKFHKKKYKIWRKKKKDQRPAVSLRRSNYCFIVSVI
jgi:2-phosphoglycerate kinase